MPRFVTGQCLALADQAGLEPLYTDSLFPFLGSRGPPRSVEGIYATPAP